MSKSGGGSIGLALGGVAGIYCIHDAEKDRVTTEAQVAGLMLDKGIVYDPKEHFIFRCTCCRNLFLSNDDEPKYCLTCRTGPIIHTPGGPLPLPGGIVDG